MPLLFNESPKYLLTSESVTEGHPDKLCDQISDAILDTVLRADPMGRVACETATTNGLVVVMGEITTDTYVDVPSIVRETLRNAGYTNSDYGIDAKSCGVSVSIQEQSLDISAGVTVALESRGAGGGEDLDSTGAGDQGMMVGFACNETPELMPLTVSLSHRLVKQLALVRKEGILPYLRPDGKSQVTVEYKHGVPYRVDTVVISAQHDPDVSNERIERDIKEHVINKIIPADLLDAQTKYLINPSGRFVIGGPAGDTGLTGRKILVDTYGGIARHGGGAFSGKDPTKVDRSGAYAARYVAKNLVAAGLADRAELIVSYAIGVAHPISVSVETFDTNHVPNQKIDELVAKHFDLRPAAIIRNLNLRRPIYQQTAVYGHFGREDLNLPWEQTDKADILRKEAGL
ncbi:MAG: methionine adenosyltransferase [Chloroflexi bacterium]|nr:methionine adenosyltransferase [Chloroflexota bacterium]MDA1217987.1 methionine adenosyltransferase [Chloroflexota bacterium]PKB57341.1 MAG: methionine adenosyltransferase [SAR202 cluster bacterium Casp-Chloro-G3]